MVAQTLYTDRPFTLLANSRYFSRNIMGILLLSLKKLWNLKIRMWLSWCKQFTFHGSLMILISRFSPAETGSSLPIMDALLEPVTFLLDLVESPHIKPTIHHKQSRFASVDEIAPFNPHVDPDNGHTKKWSSQRDALLAAASTIATAIFLTNLIGTIVLSQKYKSSNIFTRNCSYLEGRHCTSCAA